MVLKVSRPVGRRLSGATPLAELQRAFEMAEIHSEPRQHRDRVDGACTRRTCGGLARRNLSALMRSFFLSYKMMCKFCAYTEIVMRACAKLAHRMSAGDDPRRVHFQSPEYLVDRLDAIADLFDKDRTDLLVEAIREYIEDTADSETFQELVATKYYDGQLEFDTVKQLVGAETAQRLRLLKAELEDEPLDLAAPDDVDVYEGDVTTVETGDDDR